ncbi:MAG: carboxylesterase family protein [Schwartzia sp.]|nr:carboxylesterase family protein [Schwartzia sp. (in: firmicutes)]
MKQDLTRREFIKTAAVSALAFSAAGILPSEKVSAAEDASVKTRYGTFKGFLDKNGVNTWLGIPYAKPPVGKLRWQAPQQPEPTGKTFDAAKMGFAPMQLVDDNEGASKNPQSEDCLTLNIWRRGEKKNLPVMVFIHGGGCQSGGGSDPLYNGSNFAAANDVVFVNFNYRLNIFGFVNFAAIDPAFADCGGYLGTKDQIAALRWIKENISEFGGNPDNITIFGESAGAISCMFLSIIPAAQGIFNKAIFQSGSVSMHNKPEYTAQLAERFMELGGAKTMGDMMKKSAAELEQLCEKFSELYFAENTSAYLPTCDGKFLSLDPLQALKDGAARGIKFLTGTTADEYRYFLYYGEEFFEILRKNYKEISPFRKKSKADAIEKIYKKWLDDRPDTDENFMDFINQLDWRVGQELAAEYQSKFDDVYFYFFSQQSPMENLRSCHMADLPYTFNVGHNFVPNPDKNFAKIVQATWTAFAATGNPDNEWIPHWEKYSADNRQTMELNAKGCVCRKDWNTQNLNDLRYVYESHGYA